MLRIVGMDLSEAISWSAESCGEIFEPDNWVNWIGNEFSLGCVLKMGIEVSRYRRGMRWEYS